MRSIIMMVVLSSVLAAGTSLRLDAQASDLESMGSFPRDFVGPAEKSWTVITADLAPGTAASWPSQPRGEFLYVLEGVGRLESDGKRTLTLSAGSVATLSSIRRPRLKNSSRTKVLKVLVVFLSDKYESHPLLATNVVPGLQSGGSPVSPGAHKLRTEEKPPDIGLVF